jgi:hypothetical protein
MQTGGPKLCQKGNAATTSDLLACWIVGPNRQSLLHSKYSLSSKNGHLQSFELEIAANDRNWHETYLG